MHELLYMPAEIILEKNALELVFENRDKFLAKKYINSFGGFVIAQIKKAKGLGKKMSWEAKKTTRKTAFDFCYIKENGKTISLKFFYNKRNML